MTVNGQTCKFKHRKKCTKWTRYGKFGCTKGKNCTKFHPTLCKFVERDGLCQKAQCSYVHPIGTRMRDSQQRPKHIRSRNPYNKHPQGLSPQYQTHPDNHGRSSFIRKNHQTMNYKHGTSLCHLPENSYPPYQYNVTDFPHLNGGRTQLAENENEDDNSNRPFLAIVEMIKVMEAKFSSQISTIQASLQNLSMPAVNQAPYSHFSQPQNPSQQMGYIPHSQGFAPQSQLHASQPVNMSQI